MILPFLQASFKWLQIRTTYVHKQCYNADTNCTDYYNHRTGVIVCMKGSIELLVSAIDEISKY